MQGAMPKNALPYYKRFPRDFLEGTVGMTFEEKGAYAIVLDLIYLKQGRLDDDPRWIAGHLGVSVRKWNAIRAALIEKGKIAFEDGCLTNYRAIIELENLSKFQDKQSERRAGSNKNNGLPKIRSDQPEPEPDIEEDTSNEVSKKKPPKPFDVLIEIASEAAVKSFIAYRQGMKKALTHTAAVRIRNSLETIRDQGGAPDDALGLAEERGWQSIKADWYFREIQKNERRNGPSATNDRPGYFEAAANAPAPDGGQSRLVGPYAPGASRRG
ncbi:MAG: DUF1376 domain-containing protein [Pseudomonadota bacterium]